MHEIMGIIATLFVLLSFLFTSEKRIRQINAVGAAIFVAYGIIIMAHSVYILNGALVVIHMYKLYKGKEKNDAEPQEQHLPAVKPQINFRVKRTQINLLTRRLPHESHSKTNP